MWINKLSVHKRRGNCLASAPFFAYSVLLEKIILVRVFRFLCIRSDLNPAIYKRQKPHKDWDVTARNSFSSLVPSAELSAISRPAYHHNRMSASQPVLCEPLRPVQVRIPIARPDYRFFIRSKRFQHHVHSNRNQYQNSPEHRIGYHADVKAEWIRTDAEYSNHRVRIKQKFYLRTFFIYSFIFGLNTNAPRYPNTSAAAIPAEAAVRPPLKIPMVPSSPNCFCYTLPQGIAKAEKRHPGSGSGPFQKGFVKAQPA